MNHWKCPICDNTELVLVYRYIENLISIDDEIINPIKPDRNNLSFIACNTCQFFAFSITDGKIIAEFYNERIIKLQRNYWYAEGQYLSRGEKPPSKKIVESTDMSQIIETLNKLNPVDFEKIVAKLNDIENKKEA